MVPAEIFDRLDVGLVALDASFAVTHCNRTAARMFCGNVQFVARLQAGELTDAPHDWQAVCARVAGDGKAERFEGVRYAGAEDRTYTLNVELRPEAGKGEARGGLLVIVEDVTVRAELEKKLTAAENMAAVGRLAARVAHELNNPIDGTLRYVNLGMRMLQKAAESAAGEVDSEKLQGYLDQARLGLVRMARIVADLLEFSRSTPMLHENGNINRVVEEAIQSLNEHADGHGVMVMADFRDDDRMPSLEGAKLFQVCCNLVKNAIDAMPDGGRLTVQTGIVGGDVVVRFEDSGVGLPEETQRVFEAFYTTKPPGQGTGLGLAICREYIEQLGGTITAQNAPERGAVFTIRIPLSSCADRA